MNGFMRDPVSIIAMFVQLSFDVFLKWLTMRRNGTETGRVLAYTLYSMHVCTVKYRCIMQKENI